MDLSLSPQLPLLGKPTTQLLDAFGAGGASPGSGSAAALMGLLASKLLVTVCEKSGEKVLPQDKKVFEFIRAQVEAIEPQLASLFEKDAREFEQVIKLRLARDSALDAATKAINGRRANEILETATDNVFEISDNCLGLVDHGITLFQNGWHAVRGDSGAAISAALGGAMSGIFVANLNVKALKSRRYATSAITRIRGLYGSVMEKQQAAFSCISSLNRETIEALQLEIQLGKSS